MTATLDLVLVGFPDLAAVSVTPRRQPRLPAGPLFASVRARSVCINRFSPTVQQAYYRASKEGALTLAAADQLAVALLGEHPATIWGDEWWNGQA